MSRSARSKGWLCPLNPELRALVTKNHEILERYKGLVQEPAIGNFDDCTKEVLAELQTEENSE